MPIADNIKQYADSLPKGEREQFYNGLRQGLAIGEYMRPRRGDSLSMTRLAETLAIMELVREIPKKRKRLIYI